MHFWRVFLRCAVGGYANFHPITSMRRVVVVQRSTETEICIIVYAVRRICPETSNSHDNKAHKKKKSKIQILLISLEPKTKCKTHNPSKQTNWPQPFIRGIAPSSK